MKELKNSEKISSIDNKTYVTVIGGSNIDIQGFPKNKLLMNNSNPGEINISLGGVGRNIAENICRLGISTKLISALGNDTYGNLILSKCKEYGIDMDNCFISNNLPTSIYLAILNEEKDMQLAISHMDIIENIDIDYILAKDNLLKNSTVIVVDTNCTEEVLNYITTNYNHLPIFVDAISVAKCKNIKNILGRFHTVKVNKYEAQTLSGLSINSEDDLIKCSNYFLDKGTKNIFITLGKDGVFCANLNEKYRLKSPEIKVLNATGAGDSFTASLVYCYINKFNLIESAKFSMAASILTILHKDTVNSNISVENIKNKLEEMKIC